MPTLREYTEYIDANRDRVVGNLDLESITVYDFLSRRFEVCNASEDPLFQFVFRSFYRMDNAGLTNEFKTRYFRELQERRGMEPVDLRSLASIFHAIPTIKGSHSLQFSFVTKLAHTINASYPIYDDEIATSFAFARPVYGSFEHRLDRLMRFYGKLKATYMKILDDGLMAPTLQAFHDRFPEHAPRLPKIKLLDFTFWSVGKLIRTKQLTDAPNRVFELV